MAASSEQPRHDVSQALREAEKGSKWTEVVRLINSLDCPDQQRRGAIIYTVRHAPEGFVDDNIDDILCNCDDEHLTNVAPHLLERRLWRCVSNVLRRNISGTQHGQVVEESARHASDDCFLHFVLPHCFNQELERVTVHLVSRGLWGSVGGLLGRGIISTEQHRWAVEQASRLADERKFADDILLHCTEEELEQVLPCMVVRFLWEPVDSVTDSDVSITQRVLSRIVSRGQWGAVGRFLQRDISDEHHRWAVEQASRHADDYDFAQYISPQCQDEELEHVTALLVSRGLWGSVGKALERGISTEQHRRAVEQASRHAADDDFAHYILSRCHDEELEYAMNHLASRGLWVSVSKVLGRSISSEQRRSAIEQASIHADERKFANYILPQCHDEELEQVLTHMVSRGLWEPVDSGRPTHSDVSISQHVLSRLMSRGLWEAVGRFLQRDINSEQHRWAVEQASRLADTCDFVGCILPQCHDEELDNVTVHLVSRGLWWSVGKLLLRGISATQHRWAVEQAAKHADEDSFDKYILPHCGEDDVVAAFPLFVANRKLRYGRYVLRGIVYHTLHTWVMSGHDSRAHDTLFWKFIHHCRLEVSLAFDLTKAVTGDMLQRRNLFRPKSRLDDLAGRLCWQPALCKLLVTTLLHTLCYVMCNEDGQYTDSTEHNKQGVSEIYTNIIACIKDNTDSVQDNTLKTIQNEGKWTSVFTEIADTHKTDPLFLLYFLQGLNLYHVSRRGKNDDAILLAMLAAFPLFPQLQSVALRTMVRKKRWDVISQVCLSHGFEHDRRQLLKAAVEQGQWSVVRQWSDHSVHDDQREWVMKEAFIEKQWMAYLLLADHGLTPPEQMHAHYMVAKYGNWGTVKQMVERGGDITEVSNLLENWVTGNLRKKPKEGDVTVYMERCEKLIRTRLRFAKDAALSPMKSLERWRWGSVLFNILHEPTDDYFSLVLDKLIEEEEWHILMHLVRLGMNKAERDWLFPQMVRQQHWGVCRMLLEFGVDVQLCVEALPELMERNQWTLVARVMDYNVDDAVIRQVMQCAFHRRAGALFWHCLTLMKDEQPLTKETRVKLFHQAISRDIWQAVKPFVEEKDGPGIQRRDMAFLEAIEKHLWDVVDYCQIHGADINMKDENGETPLHREARKEEWIAVKEIVLRDGKPNLLDKDGVSVLNRLINHEQWGIVKTVIMYGGDIHLCARYSVNPLLRKRHTPLQALISARQADVIQFSIMWCGDQKKGVNDRGETCFHAVCDSDYRWDVMEDLIVRKVDPLAVTKTGKSPLVYAVLNTKCPERMVAECSRLGFSSHQPSVNGPQDSLLDDIIHTVVWMWKNDPFKYFDCHYIQQGDSLITSPLVCAVLRDSPVLVHMLYESRSCSRAEVVTLYTQLPKLADRDAREGGELYETILGLFQHADTRYADSYLQSYRRLTHSMEKHAALLRELDTTPRTLLSSCRQRILQHFHFSDTKRHMRLDELPLFLPEKDYLEFSDLRDSNYGSDILW